MNASRILALAAWPGIWAALYFPAVWIGGRADWVSSWGVYSGLAAAVIWGGLLHAESAA